MKNQSNPLLILASGRVNTDLYGELGPVFTSHIPICGKLASVNLIEKSQDLFSKIYISLDKSLKTYGKYLSNKYNVEIFYEDNKNTLSKTISNCLQKIVTKNNNITIVFGDAFDSDIFHNKNNLLNLPANLISTTSEYYDRNWLKIVRNKSNNNLTFIDSISSNLRKSSLKKNNNEENVLAICGVFKISNLKLFIDCLVNQNMRKLSKGFWNAFSDYENISGLEFVLRIDKKWSDIGHLNTYFVNRKKHIAITSRSFNFIEYSKNTDSILKTGEPKKIKNEIDWYTRAPKSLNQFLPKLKSTSTNSKKPYYEIDFINFIPVNEMWISCVNYPVYWERFVYKLNQLLNILHVYSKNINSKSLSINELNKRQNAVSFMFKEKIQERIEKLYFKYPEYSKFPGMVINNIKTCSLNVYFESIDILLKRNNYFIDWSWIHGDLCFSNILFDLKTDSIKVIDPRGKFGIYKFIGTPVYDLIKLSHSIFGNYDFLASDLYGLSHSKHHFSLYFPHEDKNFSSKLICREYFESLIKNYLISLEDIRLLEAGLFLSAASLHPENNRSKVLFLNGMLILSTILSK